MLQFLKKCLQKSEALALKVKALPTSPGVYQYLDENGTIIYVGKAKNLKKPRFFIFLTKIKIIERQ